MYKAMVLTVATDELLCLKNVGTHISMYFTSIEYWASMAIEKLKSYRQNGPNSKKLKSYRKNGPNRLNWQCCLAGSSKTAPRTLILLIAMGSKPSF